MRIFLFLATAVILGSDTAFAQIARTGTIFQDAECVAVAADSQTSAVMLLDSTQQLFVSMSDSNVQTWSAPIRMDDDATGATKSISETSLQVSGSNVFAAWLDARDGTDSVWFNHSLDSGLTWIGAQRIDDGTAPGSGIVRGFRMGVSTGTSVPNVFFLLRIKPPVLSMEELRFVANDGVSPGVFLAAVDVPAVGPQVGSVNAIDLCAEGDMVHAAWEDDRLGLKEVWYQRSSDRGLTWDSSDRQVTTLNDQNGDSDPPISIACGGSTVAIAWEERATVSALAEIRVAISTDGGTLFSAEQRVGEYNTTFAATTPNAIVFGSGNVTVAWQDGRSGVTTLYCATSPDAGVSFNADVLLSPSGGTFVSLQSAGNVGVGCWVSGAGDSEGAYSLDDGITWKTLIASAASPVLNTACALNPESGNFGTSANIIQAWAMYNPAVDVTNVFVGGYSACGPATITDRTAGINPQSYTLQPVILGGSFDGTVDLFTTNHSMAVLFAFEEPLTARLASGYVILVNVTSMSGELLESPVVLGPTANFSIPVPNDPSICEFDFYSQAVHLGGVTPFALSNAQDGVINSF